MIVSAGYGFILQLPRSSIMSNVKSISVVIPNYNGAVLLREILPTVFMAIETMGLPGEIIVADDCSTDDSVSFLQANYPQVKLLRNETNKGFSPTINKGIFAASHTHILLLNSDVKLPLNYFGGLLRYFEHDDTFGVMSRIVGWENEQIQDGGKYPYFHGVKIKTSGNYIPAGPKHRDWLYSMYLSGANAFIDRQKIMLLRGFNEMFAPFYVEDYELSIRAWRMGWKCYYDHETFCRHKESVTIRSSAKKSRINTIYNRNKMFLHALHLPGAKLILWHLQVVGELLVNIFLLRFHYAKAFFQYLGKRSLIRQTRKDFRALAAQNDRSLLSLQQVARLVSDEIDKTQVIIIK
jgi:GT2 family glycosyltransferase